MMPTREQQRGYANAWYHRNKKTVLEKRKAKRAEETPAERAERKRYTDKWWRENSDRLAERWHHNQATNKRLTARATHQLSADGLSITKTLLSELHWVGPGVRRERELEEIADKFLEEAEKAVRRKQRREKKGSHTHARNASEPADPDRDRAPKAPD
jgi:hypothetical protein